MAYARTPKTVSHLLRSEMEATLNEANLGTENKRIASMYLLDHMPLIDIAAEMGFERSTLSRRMPYIMQCVEQAAHKMNFT